MSFEKFSSNPKQTQHEAELEDHSVGEELIDFKQYSEQISSDVQNATDSIKYFSWNFQKYMEWITQLDPNYTLPMPYWLEKKKQVIQELYNQRGLIAHQSVFGYANDLREVLTLDQISNIAAVVRDTKLLIHEDIDTYYRLFNSKVSSLIAQGVDRQIVTVTSPPESYEIDDDLL